MQISNSKATDFERMAIKELIDYADAVGLGPTNFRYAISALENIAHQGDKLDSIEETVAYATTFGQYLAFIDLISKYIDPDNITCKTDISGMYPFLSSKKSYLAYLGNRGGDESEKIKENAESKIKSTSTAEISGIYDQALQNDDVLEIVRRYMEKEDPPGYLRKASKIMHGNIIQNIKNIFYEKTHLKECLIKSAFGAPRDSFDIIAVGDSITQGAFQDAISYILMDSGVKECVCLGSKDSYATYPGLLEYIINSDFGNYFNREVINNLTGKRMTTYFPKTNVINLGIYGAESDEIEFEYIRYLHEHDDAEPLFSIILCGTNDIGKDRYREGTSEKIISNIKKMIHASRERNITPILCRLPPTSDEQHNNKKIEPFNKMLSETFERLGVNVIDTYTPLKESDIFDVSSQRIIKRNALAQEYQLHPSDSVHVNQKGNGVIARTIASELEPLLFSKYAGLELDNKYRLKRFLDYYLHHVPKKHLRDQTIVEFNRGSL